MDYDHKNVEYLSPDQLSVAVASCYRNTDIDELLEAEKDLAKIRMQRVVEQAIEVNVACEDAHIVK